MNYLRKALCALLGLIVLVSATLEAKAWRHGAVSAGFNGGKFQVNPNFTGIGGDYPLINQFKNTSGGWTFRDNNGVPSPADVDQYGYPVNGSDALVNHSGVSAVVRIPAEAYVGNNCLAGTSGTGICFFIRLNGKGTSPAFGTIITSSPATATVTTGSTTTITFSQAQDFRAGMEVPISGTTGVTATNGGGGSLTGGGTTGAWTVCAAGLTTTTIRLCLNDQVTSLTTTGTAAGTTVVTYGRTACGVASGCRMVQSVTGGQVQITPAITAQDATTPITYRNGIDGIVVGLQGSEETRYEAGQIFGAAYLAKMRSVNPGVVRSLNQVNSNDITDVKWADRMPIGYYSYGAYQYDRRGSTTYAGTTTSTLNDYSATLGSGAPVDGQQVIVSFDSTAVTVASGAGALVSWPSHGLANGTPIVFGFLQGGSIPGGVTGPAVGGNSNPAGGAPAGFTYFAITTCGSCNANTIQFATTTANALAGTAVTTSSTGSLVVAHASVTAVAVSLTASSSTITWPNHLLNVNDPVSFTGAMNYPLNQGVSYYVKSTPTINTITISATPGGATVTPLSSGSIQGTRNPTLSLNGTTAIAIMDSKGAGVGTQKSTQPVSRLSGTKTYAALTYDGVLNIWFKNGGDSSLGSSFYISGWPPEIFLQFCIELGAHPWFQPSPYTIDGVAGITDYNTSLYAYVKANAPSWMIPRFEIVPNETWNTQFTATALLQAHGLVYQATAGWTIDGGLNQAVGKVASVLGQAVNNAYGNPAVGTGYQTIVGVKTFTFSAASGAATNAPRVTSADYVAQSTSPQSPYTKSAAYNWATHIACAQYFSPGYYGNAVNTTLAAANAGGVISGSISGNQLTVTSVRVVTSPAFGAGSTLMQGPGIIPGTVVSSGASSPYTLDRTYTNPVASTTINYVASGSDATAVQTFIDSAATNATFTGSIAGTVLTATGVTGFITTGGGSGGDFIMGTGVPGFLQISSQASGTTGKDGTYNLTASGGTVTSRAMTANAVFSLPSENLMYAAVYAYAQTYANSAGNKLKMNGYEGGYSPDYTAAGLALTDQIAWRGKVTTSSPGSATGIYGYVLTNVQNFKAAGGEFPSLFQFTGLTPSSNAWSAIDDLYQPAPTPVLDAYKDYNFLLKRDVDPLSNDNDPMWLEKAA